MKLKDSEGFHKHFPERRFNPFIDPAIPSLTNVSKEKPNKKKDVPQPSITLTEAHKHFREYFPAQKFSDFIDAELTYLSGSPKINLGKFDDFLHKVYGDYENENLNMAELLEKKYGSGARTFIKKLL